MFKKALIKTIEVATEEWLYALKNKDIKRAVMIQSEIDDLKIQLHILNSIEK
jgi:hypothetical protein